MTRQATLRKADPNKPRNISLDAETQEVLLKRQNELESELGFRPSLAQTLRHIVVASTKEES